MPRSTSYFLLIGKKMSMGSACVWHVTFIIRCRLSPQSYYTGAYALQQQQNQPYSAQNQPYSAPWVPNSNQNYAFNSAQPYTACPGYYPSTSPYVSHKQSMYFTGQRAEGGVQQPAYSRQAVKCVMHHLHHAPFRNAPHHTPLAPCASSLCAFSNDTPY